MNTNYFAELALDTFPSIIPAEESEGTINAWCDMACILIEQETKKEIDREDILEQLSDVEWIICCGNPEDDNDDRDFIDLDVAGRQLDYIVERMVKQIKEEEAEYMEELFDLAANGIHYSTIYTANDGYKGGPCQHTGVLNGLITWSKMEKMGITNIDQIKDRKDVTRVTIDTDHKYIINTSGYNYRRGMFCDVY